MAYIGKEPVNGFHKKQSLTTDGSTVTFSLDFTVASEESIIVVVGNVIQEPRSAYNLATGGTQITFTAAPASTDSAYIIFLGQAIVSNLINAAGAELILDADSDTSLTADTDDQIDIKIAGADDFQFTANKFSVLSGSSQSFADSAKGLFGASDDMEIFHDGTDSLIANKTGTLKIATETSGVPVTIGHSTSEVTVADNLTVTGTLTVGGTVNFGDFDISNVGSIALDSITNDGTDITLDSSNDIVIDAEGGNIEFKDAGTLQLTLDMDGTAGAQVIKLGVDSDDLIFQQYDGNEVIRIADDRALYFFDKGGEKISSDGTDLTINSGNDINLTATTDINVPANVGITFGDDAEKIEGDGTDLTISGNNINLTATADVVIPANVGITFGTGEKIEGDSTDLTITSGAKINLTATSDVHIPNNVGIVFGGDSEKIEGDGTDLTISANNLTVDAAADINLDAGGADVNFKDDGTTILSFTNSSSDAVITAGVQDKDIIFKGDDGGSAVTSLTLDMSNAGAAAFSAAAYNAEATLTDASTISWNAITQPVAKVTLGANRTLGAASGGVAGAFVSLLIIQDGTGSRTVTFNAAYEFKDDTAPTLTTTAAKGDLFVFRYNGSKWLEVGRNQNLTLS